MFFVVLTFVQHTNTHTMCVYASLMSGLEGLGMS